MARWPDPAKREEWKRRLLEFDRRQVSVAEFCRLAGVSTAAFYQWKRKLRRELHEARPGSRRVAPGMQFVPVEITGGPSVEVHLANGTRLLVPCHEHQALRVVITALGGGPVEDEWAEDRSC
jgi:transposase-like protein